MVMPSFYLLMYSSYMFFFFQVNHFPGTFQIGRKDRLWRNLSRMMVHHGKKVCSSETIYIGYFKSFIKKLGSNRMWKSVCLTLKLPDQICNSPYCQPYNSYYMYVIVQRIYILYCQASLNIWLILYWYCK